MADQPGQQKSIEDRGKGLEESLSTDSGFTTSVSDSHQVSHEFLSAGLEESLPTDSGFTTSDSDSHQVSHEFLSAAPAGPVAPDDITSDSKDVPRCMSPTSLPLPDSPVAGGSSAEAAGEKADEDSTNPNARFILDNLMQDLSGALGTLDDEHSSSRRNQQRASILYQNQQNPQTTENLLTRIDGFLKQPLAVDRLPSQDCIDLRQRRFDVAEAARKYKMPVEETLETRRGYYKELLPEIPLAVRREHLQSVLAYYNDHPDSSVPFYMCKLEVKYCADDGNTLEDGIDVDGLTKNLFTDLFMSNFNKNSVPLSVGYAHHVCPKKCKCDQFSKAVFHSYILNCQLPKYLPKLVVMGMFCAVDSVTDIFLDDVIETFILEQVPFVRHILQVARTSGLDEKDKHLVTSFSEMFFGNTTHPLLNNPDAFEKWLRALVLEACFNSPNHFVATFRKLVKDSLGKSTPADATYMLKTLSPTRLDIITLLSPNMIFTLAETQAMKFLRRFLKNCEVELVEKFLLFCTSSSTLSEPSIKVKFTRSKGYPVASTCFNSITISTGYDLYKDFVEKMIEALSYDENFKFNRK